MRIDIEEIESSRKKIRDFNNLQLEEIEFYERGNRINIKKEILDEWRFIGLSNINFIDARFWEENMEPGVKYV